MTLSSITHDPNYPNPFRNIRINAQLTQALLAKRAGVSKHAVLRLEQGMFPDPLPKLLNYYVDTFNVSRTSLLREYAKFQIRQRERAGLLLGDIEHKLFEWANGVDDGQTHPLVYLRLSCRPVLNPTELAKRLCISQTVVTYFEKNAISQKTVPYQLLLALSQAGYGDDDLLALESAYATYRVMVIDSRQVKAHA